MMNDEQRAFKESIGSDHRRQTGFKKWLWCTSIVSLIFFHELSFVSTPPVLGSQYMAPLDTSVWVYPLGIWRVVVGSLSLSAGARHCSLGSPSQLYSYANGLAMTVAYSLPIVIPPFLLWIVSFRILFSFQILSISLTFFVIWSVTSRDPLSISVVLRTIPLDGHSLGMSILSGGLFNNMRHMLLCLVLLVTSALPVKMEITVE